LPFPRARSGVSGREPAALGDAALAYAVLRYALGHRRPHPSARSMSGAGRRRHWRRCSPAVPRRPTPCFPAPSHEGSGPRTARFSNWSPARRASETPSSWRGDRNSITRPICLRSASRGARSACVGRKRHNTGLRCNLIWQRASIKSFILITQPQAAGLTPGIQSSLYLNPARSNRSWLGPFPLAQAADALRYLIEGRPFGRVVLTI